MGKDLNSKILRKKLYESVYKNTLNPPSKGNKISLRFQSYLNRKIFNYAMKANPIIEQEVAGFSLSMPFSHILPFYLKNFPYYSRNLVRLANYTFQKFDDLKLIDVGANIGDTIALLREELHFPILAVEGDPYYFDLLERNAIRFSDTVLVNSYLGEFCEELNIASTKDRGTGRLKVAEDSISKVRIKALDEVIEENLQFQDSKILKIDTDGFDFKILRGATSFLAKSKPLVFFEYDPFLLSNSGDDAKEVFQFLLDLGYENILLYDNFGELMLSTYLGNQQLITEINSYLLGRMSQLYFDICVFHGDDNDLFRTARTSELAFFKRSKSV